MGKIISDRFSSGRMLFIFLMICYTEDSKYEEEILLDMHLEQEKIEQALLHLGEIKAPTSAMEEFFHGKTLLITGGGGSVGGALCRQLALCQPRKIVLVDMYENNAYLLAHELRQRFPGFPVTIEIGSVCDAERMREIFMKHRPQVVCHAAAHKHVPLMEEAPGEAIRNNVFGTYTALNAASEAGVERFLLISTDKAVDPSSIMGCTKRLAELVTLCHKGSTRCTAVRFGNVLNSAGSVIPLFRQQIALGGPVTITGKEMRRFFMSLGEAAQLVLTALSQADGGDIFMLDMGEQLSIDLLARALIREQGLVPERDIEIAYLEPRPGEKMEEQLSEDGEEFLPAGSRLRCCKHPLKPMDASALLEPLREIMVMSDDKAKEALFEFTRRWSNKGVNA